MAEHSNGSVELLQRARGGDHDALNELFARHRERLRRMVAMRLDWRLQARGDKGSAHVDFASEKKKKSPSCRKPMVLAQVPTELF